MNDPTRQRIEELFHRARELSPDERAAMLDHACAADRRLRERVERLLRHADPTGGADLDRPVFSLAGSARGAPAAMPARIGRYQVVRPIRAGMAAGAPRAEPAKENTGRSRSAPPVGSA